MDGVINLIKLNTKFIYSSTTLKSGLNYLRTKIWSEFKISLFNGVHYLKLFNFSKTS
jgi:hypothetical protein